MSSGTDSANPRKSVESDHGCTSKIYFDNAGDNVTPTSQKPCKHNIASVIAAKQTFINEVYGFSIKYRYSDILLNNTYTSFNLLIKLLGRSE